MGLARIKETLAEVLESLFFVCLELVWDQAAGPLDS